MAKFRPNFSPLGRNVEKILQGHLYGDEDTFADFSSISNQVGRHFKSKYQIMSNDEAEILHINTLATLNINREPVFNKLKLKGINDPIKFLEQESVQANYPQADLLSFLNTNQDIINMMGYSNAQRIMYIRRTINAWKKNELIGVSGYYYLLNALLQGVVRLINYNNANWYKSARSWLKGYTPKLKLYPDPIVDNHMNNSSYHDKLAHVVRYVHPDIMFLDMVDENNSRSNLMGKLATTDMSFDEYALLNDENLDYQNDQYDDIIHNASAQHIVIHYDQHTANAYSFREAIEKYAKPTSLDNYDVDISNRLVYFQPKFASLIH